MPLRCKSECDQFECRKTAGARDVLFLNEQLLRFPLACFQEDALTPKISFDSVTRQTCRCRNIGEWYSQGGFLLTVVTGHRHQNQWWFEGKDLDILIFQFKASHNSMGVSLQANLETSATNTQRSTLEVISYAPCESSLRRRSCNWDLVVEAWRTCLFKGRFGATRSVPPSADQC